MFGSPTSSSLGTHDSIVIVADTTSTLESKLKDGLVSINETGTGKISSILKFYSFMSIVSKFVKPDVVPFICCRMIELSFTHGLTKYAPLAIIQFVAIICQTSLVTNFQWASETAKAAISMLGEFDASDVAPRVFLAYYGFVAPYTGWQKCVFMIYDAAILLA